MPIYVTEPEMLLRYCDGLKKAASRAGEFYRSPGENRPSLFVDFLQGIKEAAGSAHQLFHAQENTHWLEIRDRLEKIIEIGQQFPPSHESQNTLWIKVKTLLEDLEITGRKLATSKSMPRNEVLMNLALREKLARTDTDSSS